MKTFVCDICGLETKEGDLTSLAEWVAMPNINHACESCLKEIQDANFRIKGVVNAIGKSWLKRFMGRLRESKKP